MRSFFLSLIVSLLALSTCAQAQPQELTFAEYRQQIEVPLSVVENEAMSLAEENQYLRGIAAPPQASRLLAPPALVPKDILLRFGRAPFTLYLRSTNHH